MGWARTATAAAKIAKGVSNVRMESWWGKPKRPVGAFRTPIFCAAIACMAFLAGCMGGSDGIENPKVELEFRGPDGTSQGSGEVRIYARYLNPVEDSVPLLTRSFSGRAAITILPEDIDAVLRAKIGGTGALPDTLLYFNVVAVSGDREAFLAGFRYRRTSARSGFALAPWTDTAKARDYGEVKRSVNLQAAVLGFKGAIGLAGHSFGIDYVYIPGSPYHASIGSERDFRIARMSSGSYELFGADKDSATFYKSSDTLNTTDTAYTAKTWGVFTVFDK